MLASHLSEGQLATGLITDERKPASIIHTASAVVIEVRAITDDGRIWLAVRESARHVPDVEGHPERLAPLQRVRQLHRTMSEGVVRDDDAALPIE